MLHAQAPQAPQGPRGLSLPVSSPPPNLTPTFHVVPAERRAPTHPPSLSHAVCHDQHTEKDLQHQLHCPVAPELTDGRSSYAALRCLLWSLEEH